MTARWRVDVTVMPKDGVSDPQGEAVRGGLAMLGHTGVERVRVGRHIILDIDAATAEEARAAAVQMAEQLLANPVIEQFEVSDARSIQSPAEVAR
jgi:phosphoribosylformylglycinamidine synthase subunit PurS